MARHGFIANGDAHMDPMLLMLIIMLLAFWLMSRFARRQQQKMATEQERRISEALVPGTWVRTRAGFYGTVVEVDGDVVTLATPLGEESLWARNAIAGAEEPPFASTQEAEDPETAGESLADAPTDAVEDATAEAAPRTGDAASDEQA